MLFNPEPYQLTLSRFLASHARAAGFVGMGLGKTASTLHAFQTEYLDGAARALLVVAPLRVARLTWPNEIRKWDQFREGFRVELIRDSSPSGNAHIYITNYESLHKLGSLDFVSHVCFDELTRAKNHESQRIKHVRTLLQPRHRRWGLTGTPRPNSLLELFAQIRLLDDGKRLGKSYSEFENIWGKKDFKGYTWTPNPGAEAEIYQRIADLVLVLKSEDYLDIPDTEVQDIDVRLSPPAQAAYDELERELILTIGTEGDIVIAPTAGVLVNKLRQLTSGIVYAGDDPETKTVRQVHDCKLKALQTLLKSLHGERALIATNYVHEREWLCRAIPGAVDAAQFEGDLEDAWNSGKLPYLVADPRSLGHGLNLQQGGRNVVWYSQNWSRELYDQFNARVARKGQARPPRVYRLIAPGTVDDAIAETLRERGEKQSEMLAILQNLRALHKA